jgi:hypothetical protein
LLTLAVGLPAVLFAVGKDPTTKPGEGPDIKRVPIEGYPKWALDIQDKIAKEQRSLKTVEGHTPDYVFFVSRLWRPGETIRVAFKGGTPQTHARIAKVTEEWTKEANLVLDFGYDNRSQTYRSWSPEDKEFKAEIRISFDQPGYWSFIGRECLHPSIGPGKPSMNLQEIEKWQSPYFDLLVLHEFGHALGLLHEHQHPKEGCEKEFRFEDDAGYTPTKDRDGQFIEDKAGKRPGIYTVFGGHPNFWKKEDVDRNMRQYHTNERAFDFDFSRFDKLSIMKYYYAPWMLLHGESSPCFSPLNVKLSEKDREGIRKIYPKTGKDVRTLLDQRATLFKAAIQSEGLSSTMRTNLERELKQLKDR